MTDISKYVDLSKVVSYFLDQYDKSMDSIDKCWVLAFRALTDIYSNLTAEPKTVRLPLNGNDTVNFPTDCWDWVKIGILTENKQVATLRINKNLTTYKDTNPNRLEYLTADVPPNVFPYVPYPFYLYYWNNGYYTTLFDAAPEGILYQGECKVDEANRVVILGPHFQFDHIMFEYASIPEKDYDYKIETVCQEAVIAFIEWKMKLNTEQNYYSRLIEARRKLPGKKANLQEINQVIRVSNTYKIRI